MARTAPHARASKDAALKLLKADHEEAKVLFDEFEDTDDPRERVAVANRLRGLLTVHATIEEEIFYPALREALDEDDERLLEEAAVEHETARELIEKLEAASPDDPRYAALVKVLGEYVRHHVDEEEDEIFERARDAGLDQTALAAALAERKAVLMAELGLDEDDEEDADLVEDADEDEDEDFDADEDEDDEDEDEDEDEEDWDEEDDEDAEDLDEDEEVGEGDVPGDEDATPPRRRSVR